ncbi:2',3'-cyclic-nucleotide 2'-phosphodiesterase / 3'-nucleotidase [Pelagirhabdus alkalitolerans]|uniref:2',3'-cyclic-nucleotide 2'-phosphodiesterase / 3'-nucleotidase n=1 Tax=Pelagirhabdus alkalitolerans TaxID=1612202 RepID=A0A1G6GN77_9BACI|nr:bifunctional UDP-sugar hydrolase/5'-nucleotidase [Pelagirhabdus alkalitolerans]SDB83500.1 2',3'-cyclic-nucleotide 2'-phosphodiesterase / 3'-nucleotidase [Pelagirhabdus alkalitolerans]
MLDRHTITILATSDIHGHVYPTTYRGNTNQPLGLAKLATLIRNERAKAQDSLLIDNGDVIQGSPMMYHYHNASLPRNPIIKAMNQLEFDASVIGNHEFNFGSQALDDAVNASRFPWLSANIIDREYHKPRYKPYIIKQIENGLRVAILGITTHYIPNWEKPDHIEHLEFQDAYETTKRWVTYIQENEAIDLLIVSYHGGFERDLATGELTEAQTGENQGYLLLNEIDGIDVLLTGHQHRKLAEVIDQTAVIQPGVNGESLGKVTVHLTKTSSGWMVQDKECELVPVEEATPASPEILIAAHQAHHDTETWLDQPIGHIDGDLSVKDPFNLRLSTHPLIAFINQVQMEEANVDISLTSLFHDESPGFKGAVTMREIVNNYIYPNTLVVLELTGKDIKQALEKSANYFKVDDHNKLVINPTYLYPKPAPYNYDMWAGIDYQLDISKPEGQRVTKLHYLNVPIKENDDFEVVMNNYRASGGGDFDMFKNKRIIKEIQTDMTELLVDYFTRHPYVIPELKTNFIVTH